MRQITAVSVLLTTTLLSGCAAFKADFEEFDRVYRLAPGDAVVLEREIVFPEHNARVKFQGDGPVGGVDEYHPYCELEVSVVSDGHFTLLPERFVVSGFAQQILPWNIVSVPMRVAQSISDDSHSQITYVSTMELTSAAQPEILNLNCRHVVEPEEARFVTVAEMRAALAGVIRLERRRD